MHNPLTWIDALGLESYPKNIESVEDVFKNPELLSGVKNEKELLEKIGGTPKGWQEDVLRKTRAEDKGWALRELNERGNDYTGRYIQFHRQGSRRHFGGTPYWKVTSGLGKFRVPIG